MRYNDVKQLIDQINRMTQGEGLSKVYRIWQPSGYIPREVVRWKRTHQAFDGSKRGPAMKVEDSRIYYETQLGSIDISQSPHLFSATEE